jgi:hypothetical protein
MHLPRSESPVYTGLSLSQRVDLKVRTVTTDEDATPRVRVASAMIANERRDVRVEVPRAFSRRRDLALWGRW